MAIDFLQVAVNLAVVGGSVGAFGIWYKSYILGEVSLVLGKQMVQRDDYDRERDEDRRDRDEMWLEIANIKKFDVEFAVMKNQLQHVQKDTSEIKATVNGLSSEITGAIMRVAEIKGQLNK